MRETKGIVYWTREVPEEWETLLRGISPISHVVPWLSIWWHPMGRLERNVYVDAGRWVIHECVPWEILDGREQNDLRPMFYDKRASQLDEPGIQWARRALVNDYQHEMFHQHRVYARQLWILQGTRGGHPTRYQPPEMDLLRAQGLDQEPPAVGELPYADFDMRVVRQMLNRNRLIAFGNDLDRWKRSAKREEIDREWREEQREFRKEYAKWLYSTVEPQVEFWQNYSRTMECRNQIPAASREQMNAASKFHDQYIDTGTIPHAPMVAG